MRPLQLGEQPGKAPTKKSRWCVRGDMGPDAVMLDIRSFFNWRRISCKTILLSGQGENPL